MNRILMEKLKGSYNITVREEGKPPAISASRFPEMLVLRRAGCCSLVVGLSKKIYHESGRLLNPRFDGWVPTNRKYSKLLAFCILVTGAFIR
jgi:hypothetical protein